MKTFPHLEVKGDAAARGGAHGQAFRERIEKTFSFYMDDLFVSSPLSGAEIQARTNRIKALTVEAAPDCAAEISGIAAGANLEEWKLFVLNARTEILNAKVTECTAFYFAESRVLAQNWDWVEPLEDLAVVITHERDDGRRYAVFVEPGMIGKIGLNSDGIGVCLNMLFTQHDLSGLPIHILNGALLDSASLEDARAIMDRAGLGKASHVLVGDDRGGCISMEYFGDERFEVDPDNGVLLHTNHCVAKGAEGRNADLATSCARYDAADAMIARQSRHDLAAAKEILLSQTPDPDAINMPYRPQSILGDHRVGTCATLIMDLSERTMLLKRGPGTADRFDEYRL